MCANTDRPLSFVRACLAFRIAEFGAYIEKTLPFVQVIAPAAAP